MINVNIVYDDIFDDADIIAVPDKIAPMIEEIGQEFLQWVPTAEDQDYWTIINGRKVVIAETDGFVKWINASYCKDSEKVYVVARNTNYDPKLKIIEF